MYETRCTTRKDTPITLRGRTDINMHAYITKHGICYVCKTGVYDGNIKINIPIPCIKRRQSIRNLV